MNSKLINLLEIKSNYFTCQIASEKITDSYQDNRYHVVLLGQIKPTHSAQQLCQLLTMVGGNLEKLYQQLSGCFSLVIYDQKLQCLSIFNDHIGSLPCYYYEKDNRVYLSDSVNRLKKLVNNHVTISNQALFNYIYFHCIPSPTTIYENIYKLEPGKAVIFDQNLNQRTQLLYQPNFTQSTSVAPAQLHQQCLSVIDVAVNDNITDQCGAFLSGGLDSSTVAGMLARHQTKAKTFSIGFDIPGYDETPYAKLTAKHFNTDHQVLYLQPQQAADNFVDVAQYFDEPFGNSSAMAAYFCAKFAKEHGVTTLLAGDGGDELFAGNSRYAKQKIFEFYLRLPQAAQSVFNASFNNKTCQRIPGLSKVSSYIRQANIRLPERLQSYNFINVLGMSEIFNPEFLTSVDTNLPIEQLKQRYNEAGSENSIDRMLYLDWKFTLADNDLIKVNRMCQKAGVDVRFPLLDKSVVDFSCQVPASMKLPRFDLRHFYKQACRGFLADETLTKSKHGFGLPFGVWLKENKMLRDLTYDSLIAFKKRQLVNPHLIDNALNAHKNVHAGYYGELIWIMVVLELWLQR